MFLVTAPSSGRSSSDYQRRYRSRFLNTLDTKTTDDHAKTWLDAQSYCRDNHTDLISGVKQLKDFKKQYPNDVNQIFWIGLFRDCWSWSDGSSFSFRLWEQDPKKTCAMTTSDGKWSSDDCNNKKPFFCYNGEKAFATFFC
uniref:C-type lectin domain-containing protein n=1 Tax=Sander lucioperca TaxID=283035 RepID=A0A8C9XCV8_SANLU